MSSFSPFRFVFMADCQLGCYASFSGLTEEEVAEYASRDMIVEPVPAVEGFAWDADNLARAVDLANAIGGDFAVVGGDMVDDPTDPGQYAALRSIASRLESPVHWVPGNHDAAFDTIVPTPESLEFYRSRFGADSYVFHHKGVAFIVANTLVWDHPESLAGGWETQLAFLERSLADAEAGGAAHIVVFGHHPLFTSTPEEEDTYWNIPSVRRAELLDLFSASHVSAMFCGHWHRNGGGQYRGMDMVVSGPVGFPLGTDPAGLRVVDVTAGGVEHRYIALDER